MSRQPCCVNHDPTLTAWVIRHGAQRGEVTGCLSTSRRANEAFIGRGLFVAGHHNDITVVQDARDQARRGADPGLSAAQRHDEPVLFPDAIQIQGNPLTVHPDLPIVEQFVTPGAVVFSVPHDPELAPRVFAQIDDTHVRLIVIDGEVNLNLMQVHERAVARAGLAERSVQ
jgi:hypothetical protein